MAIISTEITKEPLRKIFKDVDDETFKTVLVSLSKGELSLLKRLYGPYYNELNIMNLKNEEVAVLLRLLNQTIPEKVKVVQTYQKKENSKKKFDSKETLFYRVNRVDTRLWGYLDSFLNSQTYEEMLNLLEPTEVIIYALRYGIIKNKYDARSIADILGTSENNITEKLALIHNKLSLKNSK